VKVSWYSVVVIKKRVKVRWYSAKSLSLVKHNVLYVVLVADFGFARFLQDGVMAATLCGSPMYMVCIACSSYLLTAQYLLTYLFTYIQHL